jgi:hypothetical protein
MARRPSGLVYVYTYTCVYIQPEGLEGLGRPKATTLEYGLGRPKDLSPKATKGP